LNGKTEAFGMVKHVLKDGTEVNDISGLVINPKEFPRVYEILKKINGENEVDERFSKIKS